MTRMTEDHLEDYVITALTAQGYFYIYGPDIVVNGMAPDRPSYAKIILVERLHYAVCSLNSQVFAEAPRTGNL
jgi:hypothetical protein